MAVGIGLVLMVADIEAVLRACPPAVRQWHGTVKPGGNN